MGSATRRRDDPRAGVPGAHDQRLRAAEAELGQEAAEVADRITEQQRLTGDWRGSTVELLVAFFLTVRRWRGLYEGPQEGDESHREALSVYLAVRHALQARGGEVEFVVEGA